jgi:hypothetical protein
LAKSAFLSIALQVTLFGGRIREAALRVNGTETNNGGAATMIVGGCIKASILLIKLLPSAFLRLMAF